MAAVLERLEAKGALTEAGRAWLTMAMDPWHDFEVDVSGMPDSDTSKVVVQTFPETATISAPGGQTSNWDAHIYNLPNALATGFVDGSVYNGFANRSVAATAGTAPSALNFRSNANVYTPYTSGIGPGGVNEEALGFLNIDSWPTPGVPYSPTQRNTYVPPANRVILGSGTYASNNGRRRLIAAGYEVRDTTAIQFRQGTLTAYQIPQGDATVVAAADAGSNTVPSTGASYLLPYAATVPSGSAVGGDFGVSPMRKFNCAAPNPTNAMAYSGSRQWKAEEGAYVVLRQDPKRNVLKFNEQQYTVYAQGDQPPPQNYTVGPGSDAPQAQYNPTWQVSTTASLPVGGFITAPSAFFVPFHTSGILLTGLNAQSTFTVTLKTVWEYAPTIEDTAVGAFVPLAKPGAEEDMFAMDLYSRASRILPVAVPVSMNASGDFWDWCLGAIKTVAAPVGALLGGAPGKAIGDRVGEWAADRQKNRNERDAKEVAVLNKKVAKMDIAEFKPQARPGAAGPPRPLRNELKIAQYKRGEEVKAAARGRRKAARAAKRAA